MPICLNQVNTLSSVKSVFERERETESFDTEPLFWVDQKDFVSMPKSGPQLPAPHGSSFPTKETKKFSQPESS